MTNGINTTSEAIMIFAGLTIVKEINCLHRTYFFVCFCLFLFCLLVSLLPSSVTYGYAKSG